MKKHYENYLTKDSNKGAYLRHFPDAELHIDECDLYALDFAHCHNLERVVIHSLTTTRTPHISFYVSVTPTTPFNHSRLI